MDRAMPREPADAGRGLTLPLYHNDHESLGWWGMVVLLIADAAIVASFVFAYLFLWTARPMPWPPDGSEMPDLLEPSLIIAAFVGAYVLFEAAERFNRRDDRLATSLCLIASAIASALVLGLDWRWLQDLGTDPTGHAYGAAVDASWPPPVDPFYGPGSLY
jgi:cytochrome c oxidase subunit I+III